MNRVRPGSTIEGDLSDARIDWTATIGFAARDHALPMLATVLHESGLEGQVPHDVAAYLDFALVANAQSNEAIMMEVLAIGEAFASVDVEGVLLKGAACLFDDAPAKNDRMMRDIDVLVPHEALAKVRTALTAAGFQHSRRIITEEGRYHEPALEHPSYPASLEVHVEIATRPQLLWGREIISHAVPIAPGLAIPHVTHRILHIVIHGQLTNGNHAGAVLNFKDAVDLGRLVVKGAATINWQSLSIFAERRGIGAPLASALHQAAYITGLAVPSPFISDSRATRHLRASLVQRKVPIIGHVMRLAGFLSRAVAWERDAYVLGLGERRDFRAHMAVNRRRLQRALARIQRAGRR